MMGEATLFQRADQVEAAWSVVAPLQAAWSSAAPPAFPNYEAGSWGPKEADELLAGDGREWEETTDIHEKTGSRHS
jgi:glucose-6-phosphate 1-dehydrogenase